jgi:3',5'-cyclic-AMP phosphodiesterase
MAPVLIVQLSDPHVAAPGKRAYGRIDTAAFFARAVAAVRAMPPSPDAVLITGDLASEGSPAEYQQLRSLLSPLNCPVYLLPGNHDDRCALRAAFADFPGLCGTDGFVQYTAHIGGLRLVCLDTTVPGHGHGELCPERLAWLEEVLSKAPDTPTLLAMHHPPFRTHIAHMDRMGLLEGAAALQAIVARHPQIERVLCGHLHRSIQTRFAHTVAQTAPSTAHQIHLALAVEAPGSYVLEPPGYLLHVWDSQSGLVTHLAAIDPAPGPYPFRPDPPGPG